MAGAIQLTEVDFDQIKQNLIDYLKSTKQFTDFDFNGSNLQIILNLIAYQAQLNAYSTNMIANESFLASASIRDNVVANARNVGYLPQSYRSASSQVTFELQLNPQDYDEGFPQFVSLQPGMAFTTANGKQNFVFNTPDVQVAAVQNDGLCRYTNVPVYEGVFLTAKFTRDESLFDQKFILENQDIDTTSIRVEVQEDPNLETTYFYKHATNLVEIGETSRVYWLEEVNEGFYELTFGDGYFGKKLQNGAIINISYIVTNGLKANGVQSETAFKYSGRLIDSEGDAVRILTSSIVEASVTDGGANNESISSIKFRAPKEYAAQRRCVVNEDYETIIRKIYPPTEDIYVFGGENMPIPQYGRVFVVIKPKKGTTLSQITKNYIKKSLDPFRVGSLDIVLLDPEVLYVEIDTLVYFDEKKTLKDSSAIVADVKDTLSRYLESKAVPRFGGAIRYSRIVGAIDDSDQSITRNDTSLRLRKDVTIVKNNPSAYEVCFEEPIKLECDEHNGMTSMEDDSLHRVSTVYSTGFRIQKLGVDDPNVYYMEDDPRKVKFHRDDEGNITSITGVLRSFYFDINKRKIIDNENFGTVDYKSGELRFGYINPIIFVETSVSENIIEIRAIPKDRDIIAKLSTFLSLDVSKSDVEAVIDTEIAGS